MPDFAQFFRASQRPKTALSERLIREGTVDSHAHHHVVTEALQHSRIRLRAERMGSMLGKFFCCGGQSSKPRREHSRRRHRRKHGAAASRAPTFRTDQLAVASSVASESEYHDAREVFSTGDAEHSPMSSAQVSPRAGSFEHDAYQDMGSEEGSFSGSESAESASSTGFGMKLVSCLSIMRASSPGEAGPPEPNRLQGQHSRSQGKLLPGCTFQRRLVGQDPDTCTMCWDECDATVYQIRSQDYMRTKVKQCSSKAFYRLVAMDLFAAETKAYHVAKQFALPVTGPPVVCKGVGGGPDVVLPPLLIMNVQLPDYPAAFWGANDGPGQSIVYYFVLREDFDPDKAENQAALGLLQRFVSNGREADGSPTRERLKLIPRVANLEEWAQAGPLNGTEYKLLLNYNEKPVLTRPQQMFHVGPNYLEVDLDVHSYAFLARKALWSYHDKIATAVWELGFVIQGNAADELPEQLLGCGRIYRSDFRRFRYLSDFSSTLTSPTRQTTAISDRDYHSTLASPTPAPAAPAAAAVAVPVVLSPVGASSSSSNSVADAAVVLHHAAGVNGIAGAAGLSVRSEDAVSETDEVFTEVVTEVDEHLHEDQAAVAAAAAAAAAAASRGSKGVGSSVDSSRNMPAGSSQRMQQQQR